MTRNIVICLDGTANEPEKFPSNVLRMFQVATTSQDQLTYYDPGVGTMGARSASTGVGRTLSRINGLAMGHGIKTNIEEAYRYLMRVYQPEDNIYVFGFSRGAYTARALAGLIRSVGLIQPDLGNMLPYAMKLYVRKSGKDQSKAERDDYWDKFNDFRASFANPEFPNPFDTSRSQIHFLGAWDTVKSVGWLNFRGKFEQARWPFTRNVRNVRIGRHALALDEKRRYYADYRFDADELAKAERDLRELWFVGAHSDVGGGLKTDQPLSDISLEWMLAEAAEAGMRIDDRSYKRQLGVALGSSLAAIDAGVRITDNSKVWWVAGAGWRKRSVQPGDAAHPSVAHWRTMHPAYRPELAPNESDR